MKKTISLLSCLLFTLTGCGTIIHGTSQNVPIRSTPEGAVARLSTGYEVTTPDTVSLSRGKDYVITFEKPGYQRKQVQISRDFNAVATILGNILWLLPGAVIDLVAGGAWSLQPESVDVTLEKSSPV